MSYARKEESFWTDPGLRQLGYPARYLFDWFFTNPGRHFSGYYFFEKVLIQPQTGMPPELIEKSIKALEKHSFIKICEDHSTVFVRNMLKHQTGGQRVLSPTQKAGIEKHFAVLHCPCFKDEFFNKYAYLFTKKQAPKEENPKPNNTSTDRGINTAMDTNSHSHSHSKKPLVSPTGGNGAEEDFEIWWKAYPNRRKTGKPVAKAKFINLQKMRKLPPLPELLATLEAQKKSLDWTKEDGEYIPGPLPYLNGNKFLDESINSLESTPSEKRPDPRCPRCHGSGTFQSGTMADGKTPAFKPCDCGKL